MHRTGRLALRALPLLLLAAVCMQLASASAVRLRPACEADAQRPGCRIQAHRCLCGVGCPGEFQYADREECDNILKGFGSGGYSSLSGQRRINLCSETPCQHGGACSQTTRQTTMEPGFRCRCEGTGYYGPRCQFACPSPGTVAAGRNFPHECILI